MLRNFGGRTYVVGGILSALVFALSGCRTTPQPAGPWGQLNHGRYGAAAVSDGRYVYVIGGSNHRFDTLPAERIDLKTGQVEDLPWTLAPRRYHAAVLIDDAIWVFGGEGFSALEPSIERIDLARGTTSIVGQLKAPRAHLAAAVVDRRVMLVGGSGFAGAEDGRGVRVELFNPRTLSTTFAPEFPVSIQTALASARGRVFALGGWNQKIGATNSAFRYELSTGWTELNELPFPLSGHALVGAGNFLYSFGDYTELDRVARYDVAHDTWTKIKIPYRPRRHAAAVVVDDSVVVIGGNVLSRGSALNVIEVYPLRELRLAPPQP